MRESRNRNGGICVVHVVEVEIKRFYKAYVIDESNEMTDAEVIQRAREMATENFDCLNEDEELEVEEQDILSAHKVYEIDD